ncbi:MAG: rhomboid family intramembrane serine protease [Verrucomicrobia bacterium]|nr:rhomboid family intramembrane serine protease [Verrucomicrobiota bacterium]MBV8378352.1 rhomboid family intramembrane serine protease [Verrucomicrobiota bacterium]
MALLSSFNEDRPVTYFRGHPIYCATILTIAYGIGVLGTFLAKAFGGWEAVVSLLAFDSAHSILGGQIWQILTYSFVDVPNFFTILGLLFLYVSAVEIEKYIGRARFLTLYGAIVLIPVVSLTVVGLLFNAPIVFFGQTQIMIGLFIAFCTLYPGVQWGGFLTAKWVAIASLALSSAIDLSSSAWVPLGELWLISAFSFGYIRFLQRGGELPSLRLPLRRRPKLRVVPRPKSHPRSAKPEVSGSETVEIDHLLDKISRHGLNSLTSQERAALERARAKLLEKDRG